MQELFVFITKQIKSAIFAILFLSCVVITSYIDFEYIARADVLFICAISIQAILLLSKYETFDEFKIICMYHVIGTVMEIYKTHIGSWEYQDLGVLSIMGVPLFSGFMYSTIGSYITRAWTEFKVHITHEPNILIHTAISVAIYLNFFTNHYIYDFRYVLLCIVIIVYSKMNLVYHITEHARQIPLTIVFLFIAIGIWIAENLATLYSVWLYPSQKEVWHMVSPHKITSWWLLVILSFILVWIYKTKQKKHHQ
jgi:uncharacterized membrane protein YoaT (DUF817 family)